MIGIQGGPAAPRAALEIEFNHHTRLRSRRATSSTFQNRENKRCVRTNENSPLLFHATSRRSNKVGRALRARLNLAPDPPSPSPPASCEPLDPEPVERWPKKGSSANCGKRSHSEISFVGSDLESRLNWAQIAALVRHAQSLRQGRFPLNAQNDPQQAPLHLVMNPKKAYCPRTKFGNQVVNAGQYVIANTPITKTTSIGIAARITMLIGFSKR